jgi:Subtilase family
MALFLHKREKMSRNIRLTMFLLLGLMLLSIMSSLAYSQGNREFKIDYIHEIQINGESAEAVVTGTADLGTGRVIVEGRVSNYIFGYRYWPSSWITLIMTSVLPAVSLEQGDGLNLLTITDGQLGYEVTAITQNEFADIKTQIQVTLEGDTIVARLQSEGQSNYPDLVGMGEGEMTIRQTPNPDGGFIETGIKQLRTADGEIIEIPHYAEFRGVDLPAAQERTVSVTVLEASDDFLNVSLQYDGVVRPAQAQAVENDVYIANGEEFVIEIALDRIGVLAFEEVNTEQIQEVARSLDLRIIQEYQGGFYVLGLDALRDRAELFKFARMVKSDNPDIIAQAGLIAVPPNSETPVMLTDEFIVGLSSSVSRDEIEAFNKENDVANVTENPYVDNQLLLSVTEASALDGLQMANRYRQSEFVEYAYPNFINVFFDTETNLNDTLIGNQWHLRNTGQSGGTTDADSDASWAWDITTGTAGTVISVLENGGFDLTHPDLTPNFWVNNDPAGGGDNDGNGRIDDINGWDFVGCTMAPGTSCGDNDPSPASATTEDHGTSVAGVAGARGNNALGVSGSCPNCSLMFLRTGYTASDFAKSLAFGYAQNEGSRIITNSWSGGGALPNTTTAITTATGAGVIVLFAGGNTNTNVCADPIVSLADVIAVSSSTNLDRKAGGSAFGNCVDILAPSYHYDTSTLGIVTTDRTGNNGYNNTNPPCPATITENADQNYTNCFSGTSSATPLTAGVVGLMLSVNPSLTRQQVQRLLQDTADKIEPGTASYSENIGFSNPAGGTATHNWGRLNAFEAVRVAAPAANGGRGGVDVFIRDNRLDWGNTSGYLGEQGSNVLFESPRGSTPHWVSVDIKVDAGPNYAATAPTTPALFDAFVHENPVSGEVNRVYVRVHNRGPVPANSVNVTLHYTFAGTALPALPNDFWAHYTDGTYMPSSWNFISPAQSVNNLQYSGASVAGCPGRAAPACDGVDNSQIVRFNWLGPMLNPNRLEFRHFCLFAVIDSAQDPVDPASMARLAPDAITPNDNNVTHRNVAVQDPASDESSPVGFYVRNPFDVPLRTMLRIDLGDPERQANWGIDLSGAPLNRPFSMEPGEEIPVLLYVSVPDEGATGTITVTQLRLDKEVPEALGGMTFEFRPIKVEEIPPTLVPTPVFEPTRVPASAQLMWVNHLDLLPGDSTVVTSNNSASSGVGGGLTGLVIESSTPGDTDSFGGIKVVHMSLDVPPSTLVTGVRVCYELSSSQSYITQIRLAQVQNPPSSAIVMLDDATDLIDPGPVCVDSAQTVIDPVNGSLLLSLRVNFGGPADRIVIRGLGLYVQ